MEYNTKRNKLVMPEYGRNIQNMVNYVRTIQDPAQRQKNAQAIIELMGILNPHLKNVEDFRHKLWDHLFSIADFDLDVASPYPIPSKESLAHKPAPLPYPKVNLRNRHLGKHISLVLDKAIQEQDEERRQQFGQAIAYCMKLAYSTWHKEPVHEDMVREELHQLSDGVLSYEGASGKVRFDNNRNNNKNKAGNHHKKHAGNNNANATHPNNKNRSNSNSGTTGSGSNGFYGKKSGNLNNRRNKNIN